LRYVNHAFAHAAYNSVSGGAMAARIHEGTEMACTPYRPDGGVVNKSWQPLTSSTAGWALAVGSGGTLLVNGKSTSIPVPDVPHAAHIVMSTRFLAVYTAEASGASERYRVWIVRPDGGSRELQWPALGNVPQTKSLFFAITGDALAFLIHFYGANQPESSAFPWQMALCLTDFDPNASTVTPLASWTETPATNTDTPGAQFDANGTWHMTLGSKQLNGAIEGGHLRALDTPTFDDLLSDGPTAATASPTVPVAIKNDGADCIAATVTRTLHFELVHSDLDIGLSKNEQRPIELRFTASDIDSWTESLTITPNAFGAAPLTIACKGTRRASKACCRVTLQHAFAEVIFGAQSSGPATSDASFLLTNEPAGGANDPLQISSFAASPHFTVVHTQPGLPATLQAGQTMSVTVRFTPDALGSHSEPVAVVCSPASASTTLDCSASARAPHVEIGFALASDASCSPLPLLDLGSIWVDRPGQIDAVIVNRGEVALRLTVAAPASGPFIWPALDLTLAPNQRAQLPVDLRAAGAGPLQATVKADGVFQDPVIGTVTKVATLSLSANADAMLADQLEPDDDWSLTLPQVNLPLPQVMGSVSTTFAQLSLHQRGDKDCFRLTYQSWPQDDYQLGGGSWGTGLGVVMTTSPAELAVTAIGETGTHAYDAGRAYRTHVALYPSDAPTSGVGPVARGDGAVRIKAPTLRFKDKTAYVVVTNPDYDGQGPLGYDIGFSYSSMVTVASDGKWTSVKYQLLRQYYMRIWLGDPPQDRLGQPVDEGQWLAGKEVVVADVKTFLNRHIAFVKEPEMTRTLAQALHQAPDHVLAAEYFGVGEMAQAAGLVTQARKFFRESAELYGRRGEHANEGRARMRMQALLGSEASLFQRGVSLEPGP
jgi:hypothetical protein